MADINGIPYVESSDLVSAYPAVSQSLAQEVSDQLASKLPYSYGTATPSTTDSGFLWYDSNSTPPLVKYWDGSSFSNLPGGFQQIASGSLSGSAFTFSGLSTDYKSLRVVIVGAASSSNARIGVALNGSSNYRSSILYYLGTGTPTAVGSNTSYVDLAGVNVDSSSGDLHAVVEIPAANTAFSLSKPIFASSKYVNGGITSNSNITSAATTAFTTISSITVSASAGTFSSGSAYLFGSL